MRKLCIIFLCLPTFLFGQQVTIKTITLEPCMYTQNYEHFKRLVLDSPDSEAEYIKGFDFEWGYDYTLKVKEKKVGPLSDGTRYEYSLLKVISKEIVADSVVCKMSIDPLRYYDKLEEEEDGISNYTLNQLNDSTYLYMDKVEIEIPQKFLELFRNKKDNEDNFRGNFKFINATRVRLVSLR